MQRKNEYGGITEKEYPAWMVQWMESLRPALTDDASVLVIIRANQRKGQVSDYVLRTRLAVREAGWAECEELIWYKPDAPPLGSVIRPRRTWESILWFSPTPKPYVDLRATGNPQSVRQGGFAGSRRFGTGHGKVLHSGNKPESEMYEGTARCTDVFTAYVGAIDAGLDHPAMYPCTLIESFILTFSRPGDLIVDPFLGSGTTAVSAIQTGRNYLGIEISPEYCDLARQRLADLPPRATNAV